MGKSLCHSGHPWVSLVNTMQAIEPVYSSAQTVGDVGSDDVGCLVDKFGPTMNYFAIHSSHKFARFGMMGVQ